MVRSSHPEIPSRSKNFAIFRKIYILFLQNNNLKISKTLKNIEEVSKNSMKFIEIPAICKYKEETRVWESSHKFDA